MEREEEKLKEKKKTKIFEDEQFEHLAKPFEDLFKEHLPKQIILIAIVIIVILYLFSNLQAVGDFILKVVSILLPIIIGWALAFIMSPLYNILTKKFSSKKNTKVRKFSRFFATVICALIVLGVTIGLLFLLIPQLYQSITRFISRIDTYETLIKEGLEQVRESSNEVVKSLLPKPEEVTPDINSLINNFDFEKLFSNIFNGVYSSLKIVLNFFIAFVVMIYSLNMKEDLSSSLKRALFALCRKDIARNILTEVRFAKNVFSGFIVGKILDSLIIGVLCYICCALMGMPYTPLIAVIVGVTNIIPFFGPFIGAIPSFIIILLEGPFTWKPYMFLVFILVLQQIDGNIIGPKILGDKTGVGSFWVLFSIILFGGLFGFVGMIIAVPSWAVITRLFNKFVLYRLQAKDYPLTSAEYEELKEYNETLKEVNKD